INFSRSNSDMELIARRVIRDLEGGDVSAEVLAEYADPDTERYQKMQEEIGKRMKFTSIRYQRLDDMIEAIGVDRERLCTYCWDGRE
ncbi:MAG: amidophosphoribosyltransferase, partial [bacterium]